MKIDQEKFNKLKQLDRIEYRQKVEIIKNFHDSSWGSMFLWILVMILFTTTLLLPQMYSAAGYDAMLKIYDIGTFFITLLIPFIIMGYLFDFGLYLIRKNNLKELEEEYFSVEVKK